MYGAQRAPCPWCTSSVTRGPCSAWLGDSCPLLQQEMMKQPYIIRPTMSSEAVTDKAKRINKALAQALLLCTQTSLCPLYLLFLLKYHLFFLLSLQFLSIFSPLSFPEWHHLFLSGYNFCQYYLYLPFCSAPGEHADTQRSCQPWQQMKKEKSTSERRKRPRPEDYRRPFSLLVQWHLHQTNAYLIFSEGLSDSSFGGVNVPQIYSLNDGGPCVVSTNHSRQQQKCY